MYFKNCRNLDELKKEYRRLCMLHHPDTGHGDEETMKAINNEHDRVFETLKAEQNRRATWEDAERAAGRRTETYTKHTTETAQEFRDIILQLIRLDGLTIELCGCWLWVTGDTMKHKDALKAAGCRWSQNKKAWYWHHPEEGVKWHKRKTSLREIRSKYGSTVFTAADSDADLATA